ncbi:inositol phospholipid synthesis and fat-storage-inducing TM-domain-containing protein, partial [Lipomyces oligophaga]|uniref:inositol phospholipid synthesis and fat-storage-inducing TM-domain-containing protein n=1 Tax=Lipomyces oligophaga TaxID=45792 RepID=UPI0034CE53C4
YVFSLFTFEELAVFLIYPTTIGLGSLTGTISMPQTYFSSKRNFVNTFFVKNGWFWTTIVYMIHCIRLRVGPAPLALRYGVITGWWYLFTQWFFGAPLMDRIFISTGGVCVITEPGFAPHSHESIKDIWTSKGCRHNNGDWSGGHDVSGHSFILTLSSLFLWYELLPVLMDQTALMRQLNTKIVLSLLALWWWMLLMTSIYFHTFLEKVTGWAFALPVWAVVYLLAPRIGLLRTFLGVPRV